MIWQSEWEIKSKIFEYCEGWKALYGDIDSLPEVILPDLFTEGKSRRNLYWHRP